MLLLKLDGSSQTPFFRQVMDQVRRRIELRALKPGDKLPSTRSLAEKLGIHRSTVALAYQELWALGFIDMRPGARPCVRARMQIAASSPRQKKSVIPWDEVASPACREVWRAYLGFKPEAGQAEARRGIDFSSLDMDRRLLPREPFRSSLNRAIKKHGISLFGYGDRAGFPLLRETIAGRLRSHGVSVLSDEILITGGSQQGIDLVLRMIAAPGRAVAIESPTYAQVIPLLRLHGLKPLEVPIRKDGLDLAILEEKIERQKPALVYTMPNFQNPTGITTSQVHREALLSLCQKKRIPILEDGFEEEMKYFGRVVLPIKSMDTNGLVIYCGTFSKVLSPGVRIGWIAADRQCIERLVAIRRFSELSSSMILQAAMHEFCQSGYYDRHISKMHRLFRKRMQSAVRALHRHVHPDWAEWSEPSGGYLIWMKLKRTTGRAVDWKEVFSAHGVHVAWGKFFFPSPVADTYIRLSIATLSEEEIAEGARRFGRALGQVFGGRGA